jgi:hypothetical protein
MPSSPGRRHLTISDITDEISDYPKEDNCRWSPDEPADQDMSTGDMPDKPLDHLRTSLTSLAMDDERKTWTVRYSHGSPDGDTDAASPAECLTGMRETDKVENDCQCLNKTSCWQMTNRQDLTTDVKQSSLNGKFSDAAHRNDHCSTAPRVDKYSLEMDLMTARNVSLVSLDQEDCIGCGRLPPLKMSRDSLYADKGRNANNNLPPANCQQQQTMTNEVLSKADDVSRTSDIRLQSDSELVVSEVVSESVASEKELDGNEVCRSHTPAEGDVVCSGGVCRLVTPIKKFRLATSPVKHDDESTSGAGKGLPAVETP